LWPNVPIEVGAIFGLGLESPTLRQLLLYEAVDQASDRHSVKLRLRILPVELDAEVFDRSFRIS